MPVQGLMGRPWYTFDVRHGPTNAVERLMLELAGRGRIYRTTGKVSAWTRWGAKRAIQKRFRFLLIDIISIEKT